MLSFPTEGLMDYKNLTLDTFQEQAIEGIDQEHSVLVAAPTGAGKTIIAEYAIEKCIQNGDRVIYTAPIKALSNQKYRDLITLYGNQVGIVTGDVVLNQYAQILLMTTEVFRNTIFDNINRLNDVGYVIFDEIHYINDIERGTVWEESIIFAPQHIKFICLSATIPNIIQFADWMREVREIPIEIIEEHQRPVPLKHFLYLKDYGVGTCSDLQNVQGNYADPTNFSYREFSSLVAKDFPGIRKTELMAHIQREKQFPCLYFCFSRKLCKKNAEYYAKSENLLSKVQQRQILGHFDSLCERFGILEDRNVKQFRFLVSKGIAYHHAGMLPTLKEVVERLFTLGLIQLLFTTETFAVGINMPACSVVFDSLEKYDGISSRYLKAREYHQMSGRAGRRGIDDIGFVYAKVDPKFTDANQVRITTSGQIEPLESQFNLSYSSLLNLCNEHGDLIYDVCTQSLSNFQNVTRLHSIDSKQGRATKELSNLPEPTCIHQEVDPHTQIASYNQLLEWVSEEDRRLKSERRNLHKQKRRQKSKRNWRSKFNNINQEKQRIQQKKHSSLCDSCNYLSSCNQLYHQIQRQHDLLLKLKEERDYVERYQQQQIEFRLTILQQLDYIDNFKLLPRGEIASQIYGYETQITELLFNGILDSLNEDEINVLMMAIVCEPRKDSFRHVKLRQKMLRNMLRNADKMIDRVRLVEKKFDTIEPTPKLELILSVAMLEWSQGCDFEDLPQYADLADGDFVRSFRLVVDLLRQIRRAAAEMSSLGNKLSRSIDKINRDVVDAERQLRIGQ